jgi:protein tyrosine/serine phosphatase
MCIIHCLAGKDRTGIVVALIMKLIGVNDEDIVTDYEGFESSEFIFSYDSRNIKMMLDYIKENYRDVSHYLKAYGFTNTQEEDLRKMLILFK